MADIFDEVSEDLRAERAQRLLQRYGYLLIVAAFLLVAAVGGWKYWDWRSGQNRAAIAATYIDAARQADTPGDAKGPAAQTFATLAADGPAGYRTLARLREAALKAGSDLPAALALWDKVSADETADADLRHLADLLWVQHQVDAGDPAVVEGRIAPLLAVGSPWRPLAMENQALLKLRSGDTAGAVAVLRDVLAIPSIPAGVRARVTGLLTQLGEPPAEKQG